jgi:hypothetical protein
MAKTSVVSDDSWPQYGDLPEKVRQIHVGRWTTDPPLSWKPLTSLGLRSRLLPGDFHSPRAGHQY